MPSHSNTADVAIFLVGDARRIARFVAVGQGVAVGVKTAGVVGRITIGGISSRMVIRVGVALP